MPRIIYPAHFEPVPLPATIAWLTPLATPVQRPTARIAAASGVVLPLSTAAETVTIDRWLIPLSIPVRLPARLGVGLQQAHAEPVSVSLETTTLDRWFSPLSLFPGAKPGLHASRTPAFTWHVSTSAETTTVDRWYSPLSLFPGAKPGLHASRTPAFTWHVSAAAETTTVARWFSPLATPAWQPRTLHVSLRPAFTWPAPSDAGTAPAAGALTVTGFAPVVIGLGMEVEPIVGALMLTGMLPRPDIHGGVRFLTPPGEPLRDWPVPVTAPRTPANIVRFGASFRETPTVERWHQPLSLPPPRRAGLYASQQTYLPPAG